MQRVTIKNLNADSVTVRLTSFYNNSAATLIKGSAKVWGTKAVALTSVADPEGGVAATITSSTTVGIAIPAGKTLKATIAYKAPRCPTGTSPAAFDFGPALAHLFADQNCFEPSSDTPTTVRPTTLVWCDMRDRPPMLELI